MSDLNNQDMSPETQEAIVQYFKMLSVGCCPQCGAKIEEEKQVGRCVYGLPCWHRLYQGTAKKQEPKEHPFFAEQREWEKTHRQEFDYEGGETEWMAATITAFLAYISAGGMLDFGHGWKIEQEKYPKSE